MNILVCISNVPDTTAKVAFTDNNTQFNTSGVQFVLQQAGNLPKLLNTLKIYKISLS